jgi:Na+-driven multidrug efflux pump
MVATNIGAHDFARARRTAWTGGLLAGCVAEAIGCVVAIWPNAWLGLFTNDPGVLATGVFYLRIVGPLYGAIGLGLLLYFANQGAGRVIWPIAGGTVLFVVAALFGWLVVVRFGLGLPALFAIVAAAAAAFAAINSFAMLPRAWGREQHGHAVEGAGKRSSPS